MVDAPVQPKVFARPHALHSSLRPEGTKAGSHGWSPRFAGATRGKRALTLSAPDGAEDDDRWPYMRDD
jgi:hypothetical protein